MATPCRRAPKSEVALPCHSPDHAIETHAHAAVRSARRTGCLGLQRSQGVQWACVAIGNAARRRVCRWAARGVLLLVHPDWVPRSSGCDRRRAAIVARLTLQGPSPVAGAEPTAAWHPSVSRSSRQRGSRMRGDGSGK